MSCEKPENRIINVTIITFDGPQNRFKFELDTLIKVAKDRALSHFNIKPATGVVYSLIENKDGELRHLNDNNSLGAEGIQDGNEIWLGTEQEVGWLDTKSPKYIRRHNLLNPRLTRSCIFSLLPCHQGVFYG